jgi:hypothetical protein
MSEDVLEIEMVQVFGLAKGRSGYSFCKCPQQQQGVE